MVSDLIITDMKQNGQLHYTNQGQYYWFSNIFNALYSISRDQEGLQVLLNKR